MSEIHEEDVLEAGKDQVIISNDDTKVIIVPELGGRIADIQSGETGFLYRTYPQGVDFGPYTEYGGIEECIGGAPGTLWNAQWRWERKNGGVLLECLSKRILLRKLISLDEAEPIVKIEYNFLNFGPHFSRFTFGIHPETSIGGALKDNQYHVPSGDELVVGGYVEPGFKNRILPSEGWCAVTWEDKVLGQMFPEGVIDTVVVYYPRVDTHMVLEPIIFGVGINPDKYAAFTYMLYMGDGGVEKIREIRSAREAELSSKYEPFDRSEIPEDLMAELDEMARAQEEREAGREEVEKVVRVDIPRMVNIPKIPDVKIPDVGKIIEASLGNIAAQIAMGKPGGPKPDPTPGRIEGTGKTDELPLETEIRIEHLKGDITIHGWEQSNIEYSDMRGNIEQLEGVVKINATGDYSLKVPRESPNITLSFVSGNLAVFDIASSLKISGVKGQVDVVSSKVPDDGTLDISLVKGQINLSIPGDSSCNISATNQGGGEIKCDLELHDEERTRSQLSGVLDDGKAEIALSVVKGEISIDRVQDS